MDIKLPLDFKEFLNLLNENDVEYLLNLSADLFLEKDKIMRMGVPPMRIEISTGISGVVFDDCYQDRVVDVLDGIPVNIISLTHLKTNKRASGRHKDLSDLENLP